MDRLPIFLKLQHQPCLVIGGGEVAERKVKMLLRVGASVTVVAPDIAPELRQRQLAGEIRHVAQFYDEALFDGAGVRVIVAANGRQGSQSAYIAGRQETPRVVQCGR